MSDVIADILAHNRKFVAEKRYEALRTDRFPNKKIVVVTCMDTRLVELLPRAMDLRQGDAKVLKTAGAIVSHPFGGIMRSIPSRCTSSAPRRSPSSATMAAAWRDCRASGSSKKPAPAASA